MAYESHFSNDHQMGDSGNNAEFATHTVPDNQTDSIAGQPDRFHDQPLRHWIGRQSGGDEVVILFLYSSLLDFSLFEKTMMYVTS
jgi:hypothetical protein